MTAEGTRRAHAGERIVHGIAARMGGEWNDSWSRNAAVGFAPRIFEYPKVRFRHKTAKAHPHGRSDPATKNPKNPTGEGLSSAVNPVNPMKERHSGERKIRILGRCGGIRRRQTNFGSLEQIR